METQSSTLAKASPHDAPRTVQLIVHAKIYSLIEGWNEMDEETDLFSFDTRGFNFDYLLHLSGINYLIHPEDIPKVIAMIQAGSREQVEFSFRFISRTGEIKSLQGQARIVE